MTGLVAEVEVRRAGFDLSAAIGVDAGRTAALLGPNGAGKTTMLEALVGLVPLESGSVSLRGRVLEDADVYVPPEERNIGIVFQDYLLFGHMTVADNVGFGLTSRGVKRRESEERVMEWLGRVGLSRKADRRVGELSGGEAQKAALARALITEPDLLLLDEPLAALDASARVALRREIQRHLAEFDGPRLVITHDPAEAFMLADEIHVLEGGAITQSGTPSEVRMRPRTPYVADLVGVNLLRGEVGAGMMQVDGFLLQVADSEMAGSVLATVHPHSISIHNSKPGGSPRNSWETTITRVEHYGSRVRVQTGEPLPLAVEITAASEEALSIAEGATVWVALKATEIQLQPR